MPFSARSAGVEPRKPACGIRCKAMKLSVCMATYNGERFIAEQLASITAQLDDCDEVVISDDSSTDGTLSVVEGFRDRRITVLSGNTFHNPIYNIENAIGKSRGDVIVLSDQDDVWLENKLSVVRAWFSGEGPAVRTCVLDGRIIDENGRVLHDSIFAMLGSGKGIIGNLYRNTYMGACMAFSRPLLRVALPFPRGIPMHDSWLGLLSEIFGRVEFLPEKTIRYRRHPANRSYRKFTVRQQIMWRLLLAYHLARRTVANRALFREQPFAA